MGLTIEQHVVELRRDGKLLADAVRRDPLDDGVPSCPDWNVRELAHHVGGVHRWATSHLQGMPPSGDLDAVVGGWPADDELADWLQAGVDDLVGAIEAAEPTLEAYTFLPASSPLAFWARRQAHETAIHRVDAEQVAPPVSSIDPEFAADGLDELLVGFASRPGKLSADHPRVLHLHATDIDLDWAIAFGPDGGAVMSGRPAHPQCRVEGQAAELYLLMWNRRTHEGLTVEGDLDVLTGWPQRVRVRWS
jgi:uncharacterized protein (TIGR03083 family)